MSLPAVSSFGRGALAIEYSIILSMNPIALAARLLNGPDKFHLPVKREKIEEKWRTFAC